VPSMNRVILVGNLTKDPEVRYTPSGTAVGDLRLAINRRYKGTDGEFRDETCFVGVTAWGRQAETCGEYLRKGAPVMIEGRLKYDEWEKDGQKHNRLSVVAERVQFLSGGPKDADAREPKEPREAPEPPRAEEAPPEGTRPAAAAGDDDNLPF
jgi:single-strand DNA-binding protein